MTGSLRNINFIPCASAATTFTKRTQQHYKIFVFVLDQIITLGKGAKNWYCLVPNPKPVIASVTAEAMFEAEPPFFAKCISCICRKCKRRNKGCSEFFLAIFIKVFISFPNCKLRVLKNTQSCLIGCQTVKPLCYKSENNLKIALLQQAGQTCRVGRFCPILPG